MESFDPYLTLPSNVSMNTPPDNTLTQYITTLPQRVNLLGQWEWGQVEIQCPHAWYNVREEDTTFYLNEVDQKGLYHRGSISYGYYYVTTTLMYMIIIVMSLGTAEV